MDFTAGVAGRKVQVYWNSHEFRCSNGNDFESVADNTIGACDKCTDAERTIRHKTRWIALIIELGAGKWFAELLLFLIYTLFIPFNFVCLFAHVVTCTVMHRTRLELAPCFREHNF